MCLLKSNTKSQPHRSPSKLSRRVKRAPLVAMDGCKCKSARRAPCGASAAVCIGMLPSAAKKP